MPPALLTGEYEKVTKTRLTHGLNLSAILTRYAIKTFGLSLQDLLIFIKYIQHSIREYKFNDSTPPPPFFLFYRDSLSARNNKIGNLLQVTVK